MDFVPNFRDKCRAAFDSLQVFGDYEMRKTQVALAALALVASSAAMATNVTLSGQFDVGVFHTGKDANGAGGAFMEQGGLLDHSSITINVSEDLGAGLKAFAVLESGFNANGYIDNGGVGNNGATGGNALFNRQAYVGLASESMGTVGLGLQLSPFILSQALTNFGVGSFWVNRLAVGHGGTGGSFAAAGNGLNSVGFFLPNAVSYTSAPIAGFTVRALTTTKTGTHNNLIGNNGDGTTDATATASIPSDRYDALSLSGNVGGAFVSAAWHQRKETYSSWTVGATMPVADGFALMANYISDKNKVADETVKSWALGGKYTIVSGTDAILQYAQNDAEGDAKKRLINLTFTHALSKRTTLYATAASGKNQGSALGNFKNDYTGDTNKSYGVGVAHSF